MAVGTYSLQRAKTAPSLGPSGREEAGSDERGDGEGDGDSVTPNQVGGDEAIEEEEAARKVKMTAQSYSQAPPIVAAMQDSAMGVMFAPYFRFKLEVPRIMINTYKKSLTVATPSNLLRRRFSSPMTSWSSFTLLMSRPI